MIDLVSKRYLFILISLIVIVPGVIALLFGGIKPGIDFTGGTRWEVIPKTAQAKNTEAFKSALTKGGFPNAQVKGATLISGSVTTDTIIIDLPEQLTTDRRSDLS